MGLIGLGSLPAEGVLSLGAPAKRVRTGGSGPRGGVTDESPPPTKLPFTHESLLANDNIRLSKRRFRFLKLLLHGVFWLGFFGILELFHSGLFHLPPLPRNAIKSLFWE